MGCGSWTNICFKSVYRARIGKSSKYGKCGSKLITNFGNIVLGYDGTYSLSKFRKSVFLAMD